MFDVSNNLRTPAFMEGVNIDRKVESASFLAEHRRAIGGVAANDVRAMAMDEVYGVDPSEEMLNVTPASPAGAAAAVAPAPAPPAPAPVIDMSRLDAAVDRLRLLSERLATDARSDALELGLMIARKVVEGELAVNADRLISVVKSAVAKVGESRRIVVRLAPEDADVINGKTGPGDKKDAGGEADAAAPPAPSGLERIGRGAAKIEIVADASLSRGDCVVEGEHLSVDARLDAKFAEIRRALMESAWEDSA
jgi:hypothetical protein